MQANTKVLRKGRIFAVLGCGALLVLCNMGGQCLQPSNPCSVAGVCDDDDFCTVDTCVNSNGTAVCSHEPVDCEGDLLCNPDDGECVECLDDGDCDDGEFCNGEETCGNDNACAEGTDPCAEDEACDEEANECVPVCTGDADCDDGEFCNGEETCDLDTGLCVAGEDPCEADETCDEAADECVPPTPPGFAVTITDCPADPAVDDTITLTVTTDNEEGDTQFFDWSVSGTGGSVLASSNGLSTIDVTIGPGTTTITVEATDFNDVNTDGLVTDGVDEVLGDASDDCSFEAIVVVPSIAVSAGADTAVAAAFPPGGAVLVGAAAAPVVTAIADDTVFDDVEIITLWEFVSGPAGVSASDVVITNPASTALIFRLLSITGADVNVLQPTGLTQTQANSAIPGTYIFRITATNPNGQTATDEVSVTVIPAWDADAGGVGGVLNGLAATNGAMTNYVATGDSISLEFTGLIPSDATILFGLEDQSGTPDADILLNTQSVTGSGETQTVTCEVTGVDTPGTYDVEAGFQESTGIVSVAPSDATGDTQYRVHIQRDPLPTTIDPDDLLQVDTNVADSVHGGDDDAGGDFASIIWAESADIDGDGRDELLIMDSAAATVTAIWLHPDPTGASPFDNAGLQDGEWDNAGDASLTATAQVTAAGGAGAHKFKACDVDGDDDLDLIIADPPGGVGALDGNVEVWKQDVTGTIAFAGDRYDGTQDHQFQTAADADNRIGYDIACGNVGGNSVDDVVVGVPSTNFGGTGEAGAVAAFFGGAGAFGGSPGTTAVTVGTGAGANVWIHEADGPSGENDLFGASICLGEANGSSPLDIHIGCPGCETDDNGDGTVDAGEDAEGSVFIVNGGGATGVVTSFDKRFDGNSTELFLGRRLACGDFDGDGRDDVVASFAGDVTPATATGGAVLINGNSASGSVASTTNFPRVTGTAAGDNLCAEMAMGDVNNDGVTDLACTMPEDSDDDGQVRIYFGGATPDLTVDLTFDPVEIDVAVDAGYLSEGAADADLVLINGSADTDEMVDYVFDERWILIMDLDLNGANDLLFKTDGAGGADTGEAHYLLQPNSEQVLLVEP